MKLVVCGKDFHVVKNVDFMDFLFIESEIRKRFNISGKSLSYKINNRDQYSGVVSLDNKDIASFILEV